MTGPTPDRREAERFAFDWNAPADQPHNVAPRSERTRHHLRHWRTYLAIAASNLIHGIPGAWLYRRNRRTMYREPIRIDPDMFAVSVSPVPGRNGEILQRLAETGVRRTLFRIPSWEKDRLDEFEDFAGALKARGFETVIALLQRREDVFRGEAWAAFLEAVFSRFRSLAEGFEIGHAWNRTKWGVWDHEEYLRLARPAAALRERYGVRLIGPAVIDFEFHLYPPVLRAVDFDVVSSLLYVDRMGAPENAQAGWTMEKKLAVFQALAESGAGRRKPCWVTEVNWPLQGTGPYSPASGRPNVGEEAQADYLVRYYVLALASGLVERVYWWQLLAPGYGLIDSRENPGRPRPSFFALRTMAGFLGGSRFVRRERPSGGEAFFFEREGREFAAVWTNGAGFDLALERRPARIVDRGGGAIAPAPSVRVDGRPKYVFFD